MTDLILSSGFLAFARHVGFLQAVEERDLAVDGICGTSSGALVGALWAAGRPAAEIGQVLSARRPLAYLRPHLPVWRGAFSLRAMVARLRELLPARFESLGRPFAVGVIARGGAHRLVSSGPLPEAVAASCAIPWLFAPVRVGRARLADGGIVDRTGVRAWRTLRPEKRVLLHLVASSRDLEPEPVPEGVTVVETPASGARFWSLGNFDAQVAEARQRAVAALAAHKSR